MTQIEATAAGSGLPPAEAVRPGRRRDHTRDADILTAAIEVLAEEGYDGMTIDMVAARAKAGKATVYRRWASKGELVVDAVACMKQGDIDYDALPDTGTLRGDLVAMIKPRTIEDAERKVQVMAGLASVLTRSPELAGAVDAAIIEPRARVNRLFLQRAVDRGEASPDCDVDVLSNVSVSMAAYRTLVQKKPVDREFLLSIIDGVILPAAGIAPAAGG